MDPNHLEAQTLFGDRIPYREVPGGGAPSMNNPTATEYESTGPKHNLNDSGFDQKIPLYLIGRRPQYIPDPGPLAPKMKRIFVEWGTVADLLATNWNSYWDISQTTYFFAKAFIPASGPLSVTSWQIVTGTSQNAHATPNWELGDDRPAYAVCMLGSVMRVEDEYFIANSGGGSLILSEHISEIQAASNGATKIRKQLTFVRQVY